MKYKLLTVPPFDKQLKRLCKKYKSLKNEIIILGKSLIENPFQGVPLGNMCYKIRISISSKGKGKSGGARIITHLIPIQTTIYLLSIYDKSEIPDITEKEIKNMLFNIE